MEVLKDNTTLIDQLNNVNNKCWNFHSMKNGTCFTIRSIDLDEDRVLINIKGETTEKYYLIPIVLKKLITSNLYKETCAKKLNPIIKYLGKVKHWKIRGRKYHNFKVVKIIPRNGEEVINSESATRRTTTTTTTITTY